MIDNGFVYAVEKASIKIEKREAKRKKKSEKFYDLMRKYDTDLDAVKKEQLTKTEYKFLVEFIEKELKYPLKWYEKLL